MKRYCEHVKVSKLHGSTGNFFILCSGKFTNKCVFTAFTFCCMPSDRFEVCTVVNPVTWPGYEC